MESSGGLGRERKKREEVPPRRQPWCCRHDFASGRLCRVPGAPADVAITSPGTGVPSSFPAKPRRRPNIAGTPLPAPVSPSSSSTSPPAAPFRRARASAGAAISPLRGGVALHLVHSSVSPERHRREPLHPPRRSCSAARPSTPCTGRPHPHHLRHRSRDVVLGLASPPTEHRRCPSSSSPFPLARLVVSRRRLRHRHRSGVSLVVLVPVQPPPAVLVASSPAPVVVAPVLSSFPIVVAFVPPSSRSRPSSAFVKRVATAPSSCSSSAPRRQASCRPRLAFAQGSPPKPSPRRSSPLCPSVSAAPVRRCRSHASSRGGL
ncbi:vegetative cell wall protein gp1-like [Oryza sativa Japonica Group]|uniref:vegetative cell wall protein gp1-like n=1 Tax=Oryza sativa subsp. japonica TaxID=39947 RepID=UPI00339C7E31